jgi:hypothetical protein
VRRPVEFRGAFDYILPVPSDRPRRRYQTGAPGDGSASIPTIAVSNYPRPARRRAHPRSSQERYSEVMSSTKKGLTALTLLLLLALAG